MSNKAAEGILEKHLNALEKTLSIKVDPKANEFIIRAMDDYATQIVGLRADIEKKEQRRILFMVYGYFKKLTWDSFLLKLRTRSLNRMKKDYQFLANENRRTYYILLDGMFTHRALSTADVDFNKKIRVIDKDVDSRRIRSVAEATIIPK